MKTLLIAENQLPFFPMSVALLSLPVTENEGKRSRPVHAGALIELTIFS